MKGKTILPAINQFPRPSKISSPKLVPPPHPALSPISFAEPNSRGRGWTPFQPIPPVLSCVTNMVLDSRHILPAARVTEKPVTKSAIRVQRGTTNPARSSPPHWHPTSPPPLPNHVEQKETLTLSPVICPGFLLISWTVSRFRPEFGTVSRFRILRGSDTLHTDLAEVRRQTDPNHSDLT
jgi:hypothetical protein